MHLGPDADDAGLATLAALASTNVAVTVTTRAGASKLA
jgi:hypothetical protein